MFEKLENRRMFDASLPNTEAWADQVQGTITQNVKHETVASETSIYSTKDRQMAGQDGQTS